MSQQSWYATGDGGIGKFAQPQNRGNQKNKENGGEPAISARDHTAALIEKFEEDKDWVKIGDKDGENA